MNTLKKVSEIISSTLGIEQSAITPDLKAGEIEQWDSMGNMAIIAALEEKLNIEFPIEDLFDLNSVKAFVDEIDKIS